MDKKLNLLYLGYIGFNNIGDEMCYQTFLQQLDKHGIEHNVIPYDLYTKPSVEDTCRKTPLNGVVIGGGSLWQGSAFIIPAQQAVALGLPVWVFGTGIDYFTEEYVMRLKDETVPVDAVQTFEGKDINEYAIRWILSNCVFIGTRGPLTRHYFTRLCDNAESIKLLGDPGLIYKPGVDTSMLDAMQIEPGRKFVAVNWGGSFNSLFGHDEQGTMLRLSEGVKNLKRKGYHILIYPVWDDDVNKCVQFYNAVGTEQCSLVTKTGSIDSYCTMLKRAEFSINLKLHGNVLSALVGTPFIALAYRSKCYDFAMSVGAESRCISTGSDSIAKLISEMELEISANRKAIQRELDRYRGLYEARYESFFEQFISYYSSNNALHRRSP